MDVVDFTLLVLRSLRLPRRFLEANTSSLPKASPQHVRGQRILLERWVEKHRLSEMDADTWRGKVGRFDVCLRTFMRAEGALPLHLDVYGVPGLEGIQTSCSREDAAWKDVFGALPTLERIRLIGTGGLEFRLPWNTQPSALDALLDLLEARFQSAQATYR